MRIAGVVAALVLLAGAVAADDVADVRAVLDQWKAAYEASDADAAIELWSEDFVNRRDSTMRGREGVRSTYGEAIAGRYGTPRLEVAGARIAVGGDSAVAEGIVVLMKWGAFEWSYELKREDAGWRLLWMEPGGRVAAETVLPGLGKPYVELMERWAGTALGWVDSVLAANPPNGGDRQMRLTALKMLDEPLHLVSAPTLKPVQSFFRSNIDTAIAQMTSEVVTDGATLWKLYNHGFVVKTPNRCWAHDVVEGSGGIAMTDEQIDAILGQVEALFCSHWHSDHTSINLVKKALARGIPVLVAPLPEGGSGDWILQELDSVADSEGSAEATVVEPGADGEVGGLGYHAYPGHQRTQLNNVFVVSADHMTIMQTGDQSSDDDFAAWIDSVHTERQIDVFLPNVWTKDIRRFIAGVRPRVAIPGHEVELGHRFELRHPYDKSIAEFSEHVGTQGVEWHVMAWGERVHVSAAEPDR